MDAMAPQDIAEERERQDCGSETTEILQGDEAFALSQQSVQAPRQKEAEWFDCTMYTDDALICQLSFKALDATSGQSPSPCCCTSCIPRMLNACSCTCMLLMHDACLWTPFGSCEPFQSRNQRAYWES